MARTCSQSALVLRVNRTFWQLRKPVASGVPTCCAVDVLGDAPADAAARPRNTGEWTEPAGDS